MVGSAAVIVYSSPASDIVRTVATVRHQILVAGGIALLLALVGSYLVARAIAQRVKRLELAAEQVAAGNFEQPIPVDSNDEIGQLAVAFNVMQRQLSQLESARKKFIATASHELRTPIFSLGGFVELLEDPISIRRPARGSWSRSGIRWNGCASCRSICWICRGSNRGLWNCGPSRSTSAS